MRRCGASFYAKLHEPVKSWRQDVCDFDGPLLDSLIAFEEKAKLELHKAPQKLVA